VTWPFILTIIIEVAYLLLNSVNPEIAGEDK